VQGTSKRVNSKMDVVSERKKGTGTGRRLLARPFAPLGDETLFLAGRVADNDG
jgi:hypothetical protein